MAFDCTYLLNPSVFYQAVAQKSSCSVYFSKNLFSVFPHALQEAVPQVTALWPERFIHGDALNDDFSVMVRLRSLLFHFFVHSLFLLHRIKGEFIGGYAVYGYSKDEQNKNRLVVDEYAADIVRSIYRRKLEGMSANSIADQLNSEGVLAPSEYKRLCGLNYHSGFKTGTHAKWQAIQVLRILKNEVYTGTMVQGKRQKINYKDAITLVKMTFFFDPDGLPLELHE